MFDSLLIQIHKFRKILIIHINDSNHSSVYTVLVVAAFTKKEKTSTAHTHNLILIYRVMGLSFRLPWGSVVGG